MTRFAWAPVLLVLFACDDGAQVLTPDSGENDATADVAVDATGEDATDDARADDGSDDAKPDDDAADAADASADADADAGCGIGYELCQGVCVNVTSYQTDQKNCGYCGHDCQGAACSSGLCAADTIGTGLPNPVTLAVNATTVYFATIGASTTTSGSIYQCPVTGCPAKLGPMTSSLNNPESIAVDGTSVYWVNSADISMTDGSVMSCPLSDCGKNNGTRKTLASNVEFPLGIALDATNVYFGAWGAPPYFGNGTIDACALAGCTGAPKQVLTGQSKPGWIALDAANAYMASSGGAVPFVESGALPGPSTGTRLYTGNAILDLTSGFAVYNGWFYFADQGPNQIYLCPTSTGCPVVPPALVQSTNTPLSIVVDAGGAYWIDNDGIEYCPLTGCQKPFLLATSSNFPQNVALQGSYVYWVEQDVSGTDGQVMRVPR